MPVYNNEHQRNDDAPTDRISLFPFYDYAFSPLTFFVNI